MDVISALTRRFSLEELTEAKDFYDDHGYVIFKDFYSSQDVADFKQEAKSIINAFLLKAGADSMNMSSDEIFSEGIATLEAIDHEFVAAVYDTIFQSPSFFRICGNRNTERAVKQLMSLGSNDALYGFTNRCLIQPPLDDRRTYGWHQEVFYTIPESEYIQTWAPLIFDATNDTGTIEIAVGSHKEGIAKQDWLEVSGRATQILVDDAVINKYPQLGVEMQVGELILFSGKLAHKSGKNRSDKVRYSLVGMYHNVSLKTFMTPKCSFVFRNKTPQQFYHEIFGGAA